MRRMALTRRELVQTLGLTTGVGWLGDSVVRAAGQGHASEDDRTVHLSGDGLALPPRDYTALLDQLTRKADVEEDNYLFGGEIARSSSAGRRSSARRRRSSCRRGRWPINWRCAHWRARGGA